MDGPTSDEPRVRTVRLQERGHGGAIVAVLAAAGIALAILKPWQGALPPAVADEHLRSRPVEQSASAVPSLSPAEVAARAVRERRQCQSGIGWRVVTMEETGGRRTRTLLFVTPMSVAGSPTDPAIPTAVLYAQHLFGIGFCQPSGDATLPAWPDARVVIWTLPAPGRAVPIRQPLTLDAPLAAAGESYFGPPTALATSQWAEGRYVFEVRPADGRSAPVWFALEYRESRAAESGLRVARP